MNNKDRVKKIKSKFPNIKSKYVGDGMTEFSFD